MNLRIHSIQPEKRKALNKETSRNPEQYQLSLRNLSLDNPEPAQS